MMMGGMHRGGKESRFDSPPCGHGVTACGSTLLFLALATVSSCATYAAKPIDPERTAEDFEARGLNSDELTRWLRDEAHVESAVPHTAWTLTELSFVAFYWHPDVLVARMHAETVTAGITTAAQRPNPTLGLDTEYASNAGVGVEPWILGFKLDFPIETGDKRELRSEVARIGARIAENEAYATAWRVRIGVRRALAEVVLADAALDLARSERELRDERERILEQRYAAGEISRPDLTAARIEATQAAIASQTAEARTREMRGALAEALGAPAAALDGATFAWPSLDVLPEPPPAQSARREALHQRLDVAHALLEYDLSEKTLQLEIEKQYPDVQLGPGYAWDQGQNKYSIGVSVPLSLMNQNEGPIAAAEAGRRETEARFLAIQARAIGQIDAALRDYHERRSVLDGTTRLAQAVRAQLVAAQARFDAGDADRFGVIETRAQVAAIERQRFEALREAQFALGALEEVLQRPLGEPEREHGAPQAMKP